jgi:hypothetical protein
LPLVKINLELDIEPVAGGPVARFERLVRWDAVPRIDDHVELLRGHDACALVESVVFRPSGAVRVILATYEEPDAERVLAMLRGDTSRWIEYTEEDAAGTAPAELRAAHGERG